MNCQVFKNIVAELAREQVLGDAQRDEGLQHAASCATCAARLSDEYALTTLLRAERTASLQKSGASATLEENLRNAFRLRYAESASASTVLPNAPPRIFSSLGFNRHPALLAAAALVFIAFALLTARVLLTRVLPSELVIESSATVNHSAPPAAQKQSNQSVIDAERPKSAVANNTLDKTMRHARSGKTIRVTTHPVQPIVKTFETTLVNGRATTIGDGQVDAQVAGGEVVTDFFELAESAHQTPLESGQLVRVKVPRSTLATFGLPINMDRENESVKADILLGSDGMARAIRFVR